MLVSARGVVVAREGIASPQHYHLRTLLEHVNLLRRVVLRLERGVLRHCPRLVLTRIVGLELLVLGHNRVLKHGAFVVENAGHLGPALHQRRHKQSQDKDYCHRSSEEYPTLPFFQLLCHNISFLFICDVC